jgi:tetratricopeptide (TPR) repeat protein
MGIAIPFRERRVVAISPSELFPLDVQPADVTSFAPFLNRARVEREHGRDVGARIALGAYLGARLVDRRLTLSEAPDEVEGFRWQFESTRKFLEDLPPDEAEVAHLLGIVEAVNSDPTHRDAVLRMALVAFAYFLEHEARLEEALDVLTLTGRTYKTEIPLVDAATMSLFVARLNRMLARWDRANQAYALAEVAGQNGRDLSTVMLARIGRANVLRGQGNLPTARLQLEEVIAQANSPELREVHGRAWSELSLVLANQGFVLESLTAKYQALLSLRDELLRTRVLGDLGISLRELGAYDAARQCFEMVLAANPSFVIRANTCIEMMEMESALGNRLAFERFRQEAKLCEDRMPPSMAVDYRYRVGIGFARFGKDTRSRAMLREALGIAEGNQLNEWYFRVDRVLRNLEVCQELSELKTTSAEAPDMAPAVAEVSAGLREMAAMSG